MYTVAWNIVDSCWTWGVFRIEGGNLGATDTETGVCDRDWADIRGSLDGDHDAYARLVARYQPDVFRQMWHFSRDVDVQDELVQEVFIEVYRSLDKFRGKAPLIHWIRRIATRVGYRHWRREGQQRRLREALSRDYVEPVLEPDDQTEAEAAEYLHRILSRLPSKERLILTLTYFEDCNSSEIAARTGWNATMIRVRAYRARQRLKHLLERAGYGR